MKTNPFRAFLARQLGFPTGLFGHLLLKMLNKNNAAMNDLVLQMLKLETGNRVLEIGFGGGDLIDKIVNTKKPILTVGIERSLDAVTLCQRRFQQIINQNKLELHLADATKLPLPNDYFNQICTVNTIYFWIDTAQVLSECHRVLIPGGKLVISYASKAFLEQKKFTQHGFTAYETTQIETILKAAGFTEINTISHQDTHHQQFFCTCAEKR
ncbi:class I SAM-dependent methyltransferase [Cronbergia sp. UHCC 0137]|uniref:class I SAM-dependent methyltransferase n=1 Tax=Cronbergia sp. UHCC 0137 TaxID=3110239 RepID=UPI002B1F4DBF|nr:class I SAM-dependent methyltransferase [Cronbergia sp. UHCC 0137]MEA5616614.1 class I SAM-dependent methyltransferase [Cronbergia sp. UHCC 0137]